MGRYDNIKVYNGSSWVKPSEVSVWNGSSWVSLGDDNSSNTSEMNVWDGSKWVRKTLNKTTTYGDKWVYGPIRSASTDRLFNNAYGSSTKVWTGFEGWIYPTGAGVLYGDYSTSSFSLSTSAHCSEASILSDGTIQYKTRWYYGSDHSPTYTTHTAVSSAQKVTFNQWNYIELKSGNVINNTPSSTNYTIYARVGGSGEYESCGTVTACYCGWDRYLQIASSTIAVKGTISVWGTDYSNYHKTQINIANGTAGSTFSATVTSGSSAGHTSNTLTSSNTIGQDTGTTWT